MNSYDAFKRDTERVALFGWKIIFVLVFAGVAWAIADAVIGATFSRIDGEWIGFAIGWVLAPAAVIVYVLHMLRRHRR